MHKELVLAYVDPDSSWPFYSDINLVRPLQLYQQNQWCCRMRNAIISLVFSRVEIKSLTTLRRPKLPVEREGMCDPKGAFHLRRI